MSEVIVEFDQDVPLSTEHACTNTCGWWVDVIHYGKSIGYTFFHDKPTEKQIRKFKQEAMKHYNL